MDNLRRSQRKRRIPPNDISALPAPASKKKRKCATSSTKNLRPRTTGQVLRNSYIPCNQTLFLAEDNASFSWEPIQLSRKGALNISRHFFPYGNDIHSYFVSPAAAKNAAVHVGSISPYRHIGHVTLHKFQQLEGLRPCQQWFPSVKSSSNLYVNLQYPIQACWCENDDVLPALESLAAVQDDPWPKPYIVLLAKREDVVRACDLEAYNEDFDLEVQVYAGRLLFEIIACRDIRDLFLALEPSKPYTPVPKMPSYPAVFARSPEVSTYFRNGFTKILRDAESTGYASLTDEQRNKIEEGLTVKLYPYQEQTVRWMIDKENGPHTLNDYFWEERSFTDTPHAPGGKFYYFPLTGEVRLNRPPHTRGGMVTEEMGLGKTVEALALIVAQKGEYKSVEVDVWCEQKRNDVTCVDGVIHLSRLRSKNQEKSDRSICRFQHGDEVLGDADELQFPGNVKVRRWPAKTTLVVCPKSLVGQWKQEILKHAPCLTFEVWDSSVSKGNGDISVAIGENARDIVLTTYEMVRKDATLSKICWKRLILDEAQVTRRSATQVAKDVFNLRCEVRFLMTGTPLVNSINDLKGQLAFLKIWPFTLEADGFWELYVSHPFNLGCDVNLLIPLLQVTMIRHSKAQRLGISLPRRTYETIKVDLTGSYRACYYYVLASCLDEVESQSHYRIDTRRLRTLLRLLLSLCLSPYLLDAVSLDMARRSAWSRRPTWLLQSGRRSIQKVTPQEAIQFVAESGQGFVRDSNRSYALGDSASGNVLERYMEMPIKELREYVINQNILPAHRAARTQRDRLAALAAGGVHRLETDSLSELRQSVAELGIASSEEVATWSRAKACALLNFHYDIENGIRALRTVHQSGFTALMKLIEKKENPSCPVCLTDCDGRVAITKCGHLYCLDCMMMLLDRTSADQRCAICRRDLSPELTVEIKRHGDEETAAVEEQEEKLSSLLENGSDLTTAGARLSLGIPEMENEQANDRNSGTNHGDGVEWAGLSAQLAWRLFEHCASPPAAFDAIGRNERFPSLCSEFLRYLAAARSGRGAPPKLAALLDLIRGSAEDVKFCVVAGSVESLHVISNFLAKEGIQCVGAGVVVQRTRTSGRRSSSYRSRATSEAVESFNTDPNVRVFLLNPINAAGLTLTRASVVVFMETLVRVADEIQAAARVHRIGQTKDVRIVRIMARNTLEQKIVERRGEISSAEEESRALASVSNNEASDRLILQLFEPSDVRDETESTLSRPNLSF